jgi:ABC-type multidrug transport system fused ATPase/permease subunit
MTTRGDEISGVETGEDKGITVSRLSRRVAIGHIVTSTRTCVCTGWTQVSTHELSYFVPAPNGVSVTHHVGILERSRSLEAAPVRLYAFSAPQKRKPLLRAVSICARPGRLLYVMGPSGAGKSTLLDLLAFRVTRGEPLVRRTRYR